MITSGEHRTQEGFTLIELLVVIAIIGVLSAVVLASLNTARTKGGDAAIQANMATIQVQAEIFYSTNTARPDTYGNAEARAGTCLSAVSGSLFTDPTIKNALTAVASISGGPANMMCGNSLTAYAIEAKLPSSGYWCIDSTGFAGSRTTGLVGAGTTVCPAS